MPQERVSEFLSGASRFGSILEEAMRSLSSGVELSRPEERIVAQYELRAGALNAAAGDEEAVAICERCIQVRHHVRGDTGCTRNSEGMQYSMEINCSSIWLVM
jgi:hypothetical protein